MLYEIQTKINNQWENCWKGRNGQPELFPTEGEALTALGEHLAACDLAFQDGDITCHIPEDYRVAARIINIQ